MQIKKTEENGRAVHLVICDVQSAYAENLLKILMEKLPDDYELRLFSDIDRLKAARPADILLIGEEYEERKRREVPAGRKFLMTGSRDSPDSPVCEETPVFRYQPAEKILETVLGVRAESREGEVEEHAGRTGREVRKKSVQTAVKGLIGIYSPIRRIGRTRFALRLGRQLAEKADVLYLNMEGYAGGSYYFPNPPEMDLGDLIYCMRQEESSPGIKISAMTGQIDGVDYIMPMKHEQDLRQVKGEEWISLLDMILEKCIYEVVILDLGDCIDGLYDILRKCARVYTLYIEDGAAEAKMEQYEQNLRAAGYGDILSRTVKKKVRKTRISDEKGTDVL